MADESRTSLEYYDDKNWNHQYEKLVEFKRKNGHCVVPNKCKEGVTFGGWVSEQRKLHTKNDIRRDRKVLLDKIEFIRRVDIADSDKQWHLQYKKLAEYKRKNGHCFVPKRHEQDKSLGRWVSEQRTLYTWNEMRLDRKELLDKLDFVRRVDIADNNAKSWEQQYEELVEFRRKNGHCFVPQRYEQDKALGYWVQTQRGLNTKNEMRQDRKKQLDELDFVWRVEFAGSGKQWREQYEKLVEFKRKKGHCMVPARYEHDKALGKWVAKQRGLHAKNEMGQDRKKQLDEVDFVWKVKIADNREKQWRQQYEKLVDFKRKSGHCMVPINHEPNKSLANWVQAQRARHATNKMRQYRKDLLNEVGFVWRARYCTSDDNLKPEASANSAALPNEAPEETEPAQGHVSNQFECPSPANRKRPRTCLAENGQTIPARTNKKGNATGNCSSMVEEDADCDEEDPKLPPVTSSSRTGSDPDQEEVVQEEATPDDVPSGRKRTQLELSPANRKRPRSCLAENGKIIPAGINRRGNVTGNCSSNMVEEDAHREEEDPKVPLVTSSVRRGSDPDQQEVVQEKATPDDIPFGWTRTKLEPDW